MLHPHVYRESHEQLVDAVKRLETRTVRLIVRTLNIFTMSNHNLVSLTVVLPGIDGADIFDLPNDDLYFAMEIFSNTTTKDHARVSDVLARIVGIQTLTLGYTKDFDLAERVARAARVQELVVRICPNSGGIMLNQRERSHWLGRGWRLERAVAQKTLIEHRRSGGGEDKEANRPGCKELPKSPRGHDPARLAATDG